MTDAPAMKDGERGKPILFSAPMVRALLAGTKTQTRRVIKPQPTVHPNGAWSWDGRNGGFVGAAGTHVDEGFPEAARYHARIQPGDRLWVREAWRTDAAFDDIAPRNLDIAIPYRFESDGVWVDPYEIRGLSAGRLRASMHMPRWASRLTLIVTDVRVQRLQEISEEDADAEGFGGGFPDEVMPDVFPPRDGNGWGDLSIAQCYGHLLDSINGAGSWAANPWVAAYTFTVHHQNIDALTPASAEESR